ncbi:MAG TPA: hypothetical protein VHV79_11400 [Mycobacteriales bacterium]|nr:hypothetical protein [Mycobacteriales bacterium]
MAGGAPAAAAGGGLSRWTGSSSREPAWRTASAKDGMSSPETSLNGLLRREATYCAAPPIATWLPWLPTTSALMTAAPPTERWQSGSLRLERVGSLGCEA